MQCPLVTRTGYFKDVSYVGGVCPTSVFSPVSCNDMMPAVSMLGNLVPGLLRDLSEAQVGS